MRRLARLLVAPAFVLALPFVATAVRAEDGAPEKPAKKETDDEKIYADWKLCKQRGAKHCRDRAEFWTKKGTAGKDLFPLGLMWNRGEDFEKAAAVLTQFFEYTPPPEDAKAVGENQKNREFASNELILIYFKAKDYPKAVKAAEDFRAKFEASPVIADSWDLQGHAHRAAGEDDKALEAFGKAAEAKQVRGLLDLVDVHLAAGRYDDAKAALAKYGEGLEKGQDKVEWMKGVLEAVGTAQADLGAAKSVGTSEAPTAWTKPTILFLWGMQTGNADKSIRNLEILRRAHGDVIDAMGVATYKKYNPVESKVVAEMTEEQELEFYKRMISETFITPQPAHIVVHQEWLDGLKMKWDRQFAILDKEGKLRYARLNEEKAWDLVALDAAIKQITK